MSPPAHIMIVNRDFSVSSLCSQALLNRGHQVIDFPDRTSALLLLRECPIDLILLEHFSVLQSTLDWVQHLKQEIPSLEMILSAKKWSDEDILTALKWGVAECVSIPMISQGVSNPSTESLALTIHLIERTIQRQRALSVEQSLYKENFLYVPFKEAKKEAISFFEKQYTQGLCERTDGNVSQAARLAGMDRANFHRLMKKHLL